MIAIPQAVPGHPSPVVVSYLRFSKPEQIKGDSRRRQVKKTADWAAARGIPLDSSLAFQDHGVSAFRGRNAKQGDLARVLDCIESGRIWPGCYLSIESLDRLSRQKTMESVSLIQRILEAGVRVVAHVPSERIYTEESASNTYELIEMVLAFARAHEESETKSQRLSEAWGSKRSVTADKKLTARCPAWLAPVRKDPTDPKSPIVDFEPVKDHVTTVRRVFQLSHDGLGQSAICRALNADSVPTFGKSSFWRESTVSKLLKDRSVIGEHQPHKMADDDGRRVRVPVGDPIPDYFPAIVSEQEFYAVQAAITGRMLPRGKHADRVTNLFVGLLVDARDDHPCMVVNKGKKSGGPAIVNSAAVDGDAVYLGFPYDRFEAAVLALVTEIDLTAVMPRKASRLGKQIVKAAEEVTAIQQRIREIKVRTKKRNRGIGTLLDLLSESETELIDAKDRLDSLRRQQASPAEDGLRTTKGLIEKLAKAKDRQAIRTKMRATIRQFVQRVRILTVNINARDRVLIADVELASSKRIKLAIETGEPAPKELYKLDLTDFDKWPKKWQATSFAVMPAIDQPVLDLDDKGYLISEIARRLELGQSRVSRILTKHGRRRQTRRPRDSKQLMTWHAAGNGWVKQHKGKRYFVGCGKLKELYPRLVKSLDRGGTMKSANRWWTEQIS